MPGPGGAVLPLQVEAGEPVVDDGGTMGDRAKQQRHRAHEDVIGDDPVDAGPPQDLPQPGVLVGHPVDEDVLHDVSKLLTPGVSGRAPGTPRPCRGSKSALPWRGTNRASSPAGAVPQGRRPAGSTLDRPLTGSGRHATRSTEAPGRSMRTSTDDLAPGATRNRARRASTGRCGGNVRPGAHPRRSTVSARSAIGDTKNVFFLTSPRPQRA